MVWDEILFTGTWKGHFCSLNGKCSTFLKHLVIKSESVKEEMKIKKGKENNSVSPLVSMVTSCGVG